MGPTLSQGVGLTPIVPLQETEPQSPSQKGRFGFATALPKRAALIDSIITLIGDYGFGGVSTLFRLLLVSTLT